MMAAKGVFHHRDLVHQDLQRELWVGRRASFERGQTMIDFNSLIALVLGLSVPALVAYNVWRVVRRGRQFKALREHGVSAQAVVTDKVAFNSSDTVRQGRLIYTFRAPDGALYEHRSLVSAEVFDSVNPGSALEVVYVPDNPVVNAPRYLIDQLRSTSEKSP